MLSFIEYLTETIKFQRGKDQDYLTGKNTVIFFSEDGPEKYKQRGKTHGIQSHALKHLKEFQPGIVASLIAEIRSTIKIAIYDEIVSFVGLYKRGGNWITTNPNEVLTKVSDNALINTLDVINDKFIMKEPLNAPEKRLRIVLDKFEEAYQKEIESRWKKAFNLDSLEGTEEVEHAVFKEPVIKFSGKDGSGTAKSYCLCMKDSAMIISSGDSIRTMYKISKQPHSPKELLTIFFRKMKDVKFDSKITKEVLEIITYGNEF